MSKAEVIEELNALGARLRRIEQGHKNVLDVMFYVPQEADREMAAALR